ncbi:MAG: hypothetical protein ACR2G3_10630 [Solirubrobacterales bacterium]
MAIEAFLDLGGLGEADIMALVFLVMMAAAAAAREDLKAIMDGMRQTQEPRWRAMLGLGAVGASLVVLGAGAGLLLSEPADEQPAPAPIRQIEGRQITTIRTTPAQTTTTTTMPTQTTTTTTLTQTTTTITTVAPRGGSTPSSGTEEPAPEQPPPTEESPPR